MFFKRWAISVICRQSVHEDPSEFTAVSRSFVEEGDVSMFDEAASTGPECNNLPLLISGFR